MEETDWYLQCKWCTGNPYKICQATSNKPHKVYMYSWQLMDNQ